MQSKILDLKDAVTASEQLISEGKKVVLAGGVFDVIHEGHIEFIKKSREIGQSLFLLLENDLNVREIKGDGRPINNQGKRAENLKKLDLADVIIPLPYMKNDKDYDRLVSSIKPAIIAATFGEPGSKHKKRQAKMVGGQFIYIMERLPHLSTTELINGKNI